MASWDVPLGTTTTREELKAVWGGSEYSGGIVPAVQSSTIFLFSDPAEGTKYGYDWDGASSDGLAYYYTGAGQNGDQKLTDRNGSVLRHEAAGRVLQLFVADGYVPGTGTKLQRYVGQFRVDPSAPYRMEPAANKAKQSRVVVVFRLLPVGQSDLAGLVEAGAFAPEPDTGPTSVLMPLEVDSKFFYETSGTESTVAQKKEGLVVSDFRSWAGGGESRFRRWAIRVPGEKTRLITDIFDTFHGILFEAKASSSRGYVRLALGQLLDYSRHVPEVKHLMVLLPSRPSDDLLSLLHAHGVGCVWQTESGFDMEPNVYSR